MCQAPETNISHSSSVLPAVLQCLFSKLEMLQSGSHWHLPWLCQLERGPSTALWGFGLTQRWNSPRLCQGLNIQENFFTERVVKHCDRLPGAVLESPSLELFKNVCMWLLGVGSF